MPGRPRKLELLVLRRSAEVKLALRKRQVLMRPGPFIDGAFG